MDSRGSSIDDGPSRPLKPKKDSEVPSRTLNPNMVYRPEMAPANQYPANINEDKPLARFHISIIWILRLLVLIFTFANIIVQLISRPGVGLSKFLVALSFFILFWTIFALLPRSIHKSIKAPFIIPHISCSIGRWKFHYCGGDDDGDADSEYIYDIVDTPPRKTANTGRALVDFFFGTLVLICTIPIIAGGGRYGIWRWWNGCYIVIAVLHFLVVALLYILTILQHILFYRGVEIAISIHPQRDTTHSYRIRLPQDEHVESATKEPGARFV
ncbi:hypothetical protein BX600DRAFT_549649 [Xylariales sp. PMI_506]|nr:hypothetical protein BX600DRAFT_549649 [Xylariales sp. PMI_506]